MRPVTPFMMIPTLRSRIAAPRIKMLAYSTESYHNDRD